MKKKALSFLLAISIVFALSVSQPVQAQAAQSAQAMTAEILSRYGFNSVIGNIGMLEDVLETLALFPAGMLRELADGYRREGITPLIRQGDVVYTEEDLVGDVIIGRARLTASGVVITLYMARALAHEIGHLLDWYLGMRSGRSSASAALVDFNGRHQYGGEHDPDVFSTWYGSTSHFEDFAEIIYQLFVWPEMVRDYIADNPDTPLTRKYQYVMSLLVDGFQTLSCVYSAFPAVFEIKVFLNGRSLRFDVPPQTVNGRTLVPLRGIFDELRASVFWNSSTRTVFARRDGVEVVLTIGDTAPTVNGRVVPIDQPGIIVDGRTLAPLRFVAEAFGATAGWDSATRTVHISTLPPL